MDRKFLKELGIEDEQIDKIMQEHGATVNPLKQDKDSLQTEVDSYKEQITERDTQLETLKGKVGSEDDLKATIDSLKQANQEKDAEHQKRINQQKLDYELKIALNGSGARNERAVKALLDLDTVKINDEGQLIGLNEQLETLKTSDDYLFKTDAPPVDEPPNTDFTPGSNKQGNNGKEMTDEAFAKAKFEELFGKKKEEN